MKISVPSHLTDIALLDAVKRFAGRLYAGAGFSSMFKYCCQVLQMSEDAAYNRLETARAAHRFPVILTALASGALNVTTVRLLARRLTPENHVALLAAASGRSKREVEELVARHYSQPDVPSSVRKQPTRPMDEAVLSRITPAAVAREELLPKAPALIVTAQHRAALQDAQRL